MFLLFSKLQNIECKNKIDFSFSPICSTDCTLQSGILNSTCKNRDIRLVSSRWVTLMQQLNKTKYIESKMSFKNTNTAKKYAVWSQRVNIQSSRNNGHFSSRCIFKAHFM